MASTIVRDRWWPLGGVRSRLYWEGVCADGWHEPPRLLYDTELVLTTLGPFTLEIDGRVHEMRPGSAALIPPETWHESRVAADGRTRRACFHFGWSGEDLRRLPLQAASRRALDQRLVQRLPDAVRPRLPLVCAPEAMRPARALVALLVREARAGGALVDTCLAAVVAWMLAAGAPGAGGPRRDHPALRVKHLIDERYAQPLSSRDLARVAGLSRAHLCTTFRRQVGVAPNEYLIAVRLHHAQRLLRAGATVAETARAVGIADPNYFTRLFRARLGAPPARWRDALGA